MKKILVVLLGLGLIATVAHAQSREAKYPFVGETYFEKVGATGNSSTGNVGYLVLTGRDGNDAIINYYLWIDNTGDLRIASYATISAFSSFPLGNWQLPNFGAGTVVGSQS